jgi:hypothetical protein
MMRAAGLAAMIWRAGAMASSPHAADTSRRLRYPTVVDLLATRCRLPEPSLRAG